MRETQPLRTHHVSEHKRHSDRSPYRVFTVTGVFILALIVIVAVAL